MDEKKEELELEAWDPRQEAMEEMVLEKHDRLAMVLAGFLTLGLPILLMIAFIVGLTLLLFT